LGVEPRRIHNRHPRAGGDPDLSIHHNRLWDTGSSAFADDDTEYDAMSV